MLVLKMLALPFALAFALAFAMVCYGNDELVGLIMLTRIPRANTRWYDLRLTRISYRVQLN